MMRRVTAPLFISTLLLAVPIIGLACGGGDSAQPPTSEVTPTAAPPSPTPTPTPEAEKTLGHYENAELGFAFDYRASWELITEPLRAAEEIGEARKLANVILGRLVEDPLHVEGIALNVYQHQSTPEEDVEEALLELDDLIAQLMGQAGGAIAEADWTELGGAMARRYVLNFPHPVGVPMISEKVVTFRGDLQFELDCQAEAYRFQDVDAECQSVFDSFEFSPGQ